MVFQPHETVLKHAFAGHKIQQPHESVPNHVFAGQNMQQWGICFHTTHTHSHSLLLLLHSRYAFGRRPTAPLHLQVRLLCLLVTTNIFVTLSVDSATLKGVLQWNCATILTVQRKCQCMRNKEGTSSLQGMRCQ